MDGESSPFCAATEEPLSTRAPLVVGQFLLDGLVVRRLATEG